jgi:transcriptional regulator
MYRPPSFAVDDLEVIVGLTRTAGFGHLVVTTADGKLSATPMPFVIADDASSVRAHLARPNDVWRVAPCRALLIVPVSDTYISPAWYPSKAEHGKVVPTWNYEVVHFHGQLVAHDDAAWVAKQIRDLTDLNESSFEPPWAVDDAPADYIAAMQRGIVGVELVVERIEGKRKLSQNRSDDDLAATIASLMDSDRRGAAAVSAAMIAAEPSDEPR